MKKKVSAVSNSELFIPFYSIMLKYLLRLFNAVVFWEVLASTPTLHWFKNGDPSRVTVHGFVLVGLG